MSRIIIASASVKSRSQLMGLLASSGMDVYRACANGGELRRTLNNGEDGVVVIAGSMPDCPPDDLVGDFGEGFQVLLIGRPKVLEACESPRVFKLAYPCAGSVVIGAIEMLTQLHRMRLPRRRGDDRALIERAKAKLMLEGGLSEPEAHRQLQQYAMTHGVKMTDYAARLLDDE